MARTPSRSRRGGRSSTAMRGVASASRSLRRRPRLAPCGSMNSGMAGSGSVLLGPRPSDHGAVARVPFLDDAERRLPERAERTGEPPAPAVARPLPPEGAREPALAPERLEDRLVAAFLEGRIERGGALFPWRHGRLGAVGEADFGEEDRPAPPLRGRLEARDEFPHAR